MTYEIYYKAFENNRIVYKSKTFETSMDLVSYKQFLLNNGYVILAITADKNESEENYGIYSYKENRY